MSDDEEDKNNTSLKNLSGGREDILVFLIGNTKEWDDSRDDGGDVDLYKCFSELVPSQNIRYVQDDDCTKKKCEEKLKELLLSKQQQPNDTLVFYYSGHGVSSGFSTNPIWKYDEAIQYIHQHFRGNKVWCLIDCCFSGAFLEKLRSFLSSSNNDKTYLCITSTLADTEAYDCTTDQWNLSGPFIRAMRGQMKNCSISDHRQVITTEQLIADMSYRHAVIDGNLMQCELIGDYHQIHPQKPFPFLIRSVYDTTRTSSILSHDNNSYNDTNSHTYHNFMTTVSALDDKTHRISNIDEMKKKVEETNTSRSTEDSDESGSGSDSDSDSVHEWKQLIHLKKGDHIYAKWNGGFPSFTSKSNDNQQPTRKYIFPLYYKATILSDTNLLTHYDSKEEKAVEVEYQFEENYKWKSKCPLSSCQNVILPFHYFSYDTEELLQSHVLLAKHKRYIDVRFLPTGSKVWAIYENQIYHGTISPPHNLVTYKIVHDPMYDGYEGPFIWVEWDNEGGDQDLIPTYHCLPDTDNSSQTDTATSIISKGNLKKSKNKRRGKPSVQSILDTHNEMIQKYTKNNTTTMTPLECMLKGMESMGRRLVLRDKRQTVQCYYNGEWYEAMISCEVPSLNVLSGHLRYLLPGDYYCVQWHQQDGSHSVLPKALLKEIL